MGGWHFGAMGVIMMMVMKATTTTKKTTVGGDGLLSFFSIPNDCFIVLVYMHYHCFEYLFMHQIFSSGSGFFSFVCFCLFEEVTRGFTVLLVPYCLVQGVVFFCSCSA